MKHLFTDADRRRIEEAVAAAEERTSGEIVPVVVARSDEYRFVGRRSAVIGLVTGALLFEVLRLVYSGWAPAWLTGDLTLFLFMLAGAGLFWLAAVRIDPLARLLIGRAEIDRAVHRRAVLAFVDNEVFDTRERTGIVLLVSLFEHRVEVFGDSGINRQVSEDDWAEVIEDVVDGIRRGDPAGGLVAGIERCGHLLERLGVERRDDDRDELSNQLRIE